MKIAQRIHIGLCPDCNSVHVSLFDDEGDVPCADASLSPDVAERMAFDLMKAAKKARARTASDTMGPVAGQA